MELDDNQLRIQNSSERTNLQSYDFPDPVVQQMKERTLTKEEFLQALANRFADDVVSVIGGDREEGVERIASRLSPTQ